MERSTHDQLLAQGASPEEAAAVVVAIARFAAAPPPPHAPVAQTGGWLRAARLEAVGESAGGASPWGDPHPWI